MSEKYTMADKLLIVHGYSDGSTSFTALGDFLVKQGVYSHADVFYLDYSSMDDQATFRDFADKLDADHRLLLNGERVERDLSQHGLARRAGLARAARRTQSAAKTGRGLPDRSSVVLCAGELRIRSGWPRAVVPRQVQNHVLQLQFAQGRLSRIGQSRC